MQWLILAAIVYYLYTQGGLSIPGQRPVPITTIDTLMPGGIVLGLPLPPGYRAYRLADGTQVLISPNAPQAPGGWVQATRAGELIWFNETTGQVEQRNPQVSSLH